MTALPDWVGVVERSRAEGHLLDLAQSFSTDDLKRLANHILEVIDPDGAEEHAGEQLDAEEKKAHGKTELIMFHAGNGMTRGRFQLPTVQASMLRSVLEGLASPRRNSPAIYDRDGDHSEAASGTLTHQQKLGRAFCELIEHLPTDAMPQHGGLAASVTITMTLDQLRDGLGTALLSTGQEMSANQARRFACNANLIPMVLDGDTKILDLGLGKRLFNRYERCPTTANGTAEWPPTGSPKSPHPDASTRTRNPSATTDSNPGHSLSGMTSTEKLVLFESDGPIRTIRLNAPERRNALDLELLAELATAIATVKADPDARALIVAGAGKAFCAGANLESMFGDTTRPVHELRNHLKGVYASFLGLRELTIPTFAAVQGAAVGAGLNIALACDIVVAGPRAAFGPTFAEIGLHPGGGCSWMLTERMGAGNATAALLSGDIITADDAIRLGLANVLADEPEAKARELADRCATRSRELNANIKRSVRIAATSDLQTSIDFESWAQASSVGSDEFRRYLDTFLKN